LLIVFSPTITRMPTSSPRQNSLVLYKQKPARVRQLDSKKLMIEVAGSGTVNVRPKDVSLLHPGPLKDLAQLSPITGEVETAWELLEGETPNLEDLAELAFDEYTVASAWASWQLVADGLYFSGTPDEIIVRTQAEVEAEKSARLAKAEKQRAWDSFLERAAAGETAPEDGRFIEEIIPLALEQRKGSRVLKALGQAETPQNAHALLLKLGVWDITFNPYPVRAGLPTSSADVPLDPLPEEPRRDLTHLQALAIDDEGSLDPDDALSWEDGRLWVHIADAAALIPPDSPADIEARARGANLYLPEGMVTMLPPEATQILALGLSEISPALSFGLDLDEAGEIVDFEIITSLIRVTRLSYREAEERLQESPFKELLAAAQLYESRRHENGAINIDLPEVKIRVVEDGIEIRPLPRLRSRDLVREAMLMAGEAVARYAIEHKIPLPYTSQDAPTAEMPTGDTPSAYFATRMMLRPGHKSTAPGLHAGLGMDLYAQATSPLRRYLDLVVHQQLRAHLTGAQPLDTQMITTLIGSADSGTRDVRRTERLSNRHWISVYLLQNPGWQGEGIVVEVRGNRHKVLLPQLGTETNIYGRQVIPLDSQIELELRDIDLVNLEANFRQM
jgi:exoribonuclease-2